VSHAYAVWASMHNSLRSVGPKEPRMHSVGPTAPAPACLSPCHSAGMCTTPMSCSALRSALS
jgi:hypothetical protein